MTVKALIRQLTLREGLKKKTDISQVTEIVGHLSDLIFEEFQTNIDFSEILGKLLTNGSKRFVAKQKKLRGKNATTK